MTKRYSDNDSVLRSAQHGMNITPSGSTLTEVTRFIMVDTDDATITGILEGDTLSHTTVPLKAGIVYPFSFKVISVVSSGNVKGYY